MSYPVWRKPLLAYMRSYFMSSSNFDALIRMLELREKRQREALEETVKQLSEARAAASSKPAKAS